VISIGNLTFGGSGKTPIAAAIAAALRDRGERPAILSRGYKRRRVEPGVVLVSDGRRILADLDRAGDEPLMLARTLPGVVVAVAADRFLAGRLVELHCGVTVHVLDDGFQHVALARDVDVLVMDGREQTGVPLRERPDAAMVSDAILLQHDASADALPPRPTFRWRRTMCEPVPIGNERGLPARSFAQLGAVMAVAAIAAPARFFEDLRRAGVDLRETMSFRDHHAYTSADLAAVVARARAAHCASVVTTEKDAMRLRRFRPLPIEVSVVPVKVEFEPAGAFDDWLIDHLSYARARRRAA
jgi:tetraacyldisaccharide 4'-kinase